MIAHDLRHQHGNFRKAVHNVGGHGVHQSQCNLPDATETSNQDFEKDISLHEQMRSGILALKSAGDTRCYSYVL